MFLLLILLCQPITGFSDFKHEVKIQKLGLTTFGSKRLREDLI